MLRGHNYNTARKFRDFKANIQRWGNKRKTIPTNVSVDPSVSICRVWNTKLFVCVKGKARGPMTLEVMKYKTCKLAGSHGVFVASSKPAWILAYVWHVKETYFARSELPTLHNKPKAEVHLGH